MEPGHELAFYKRKTIPKLSYHLPSHHSHDISTGHAHNMKVETIRLLKENTGDYLYDLGVSQDLLDGMQEELTIKQKI